MTHYQMIEAEEKEMVRLAQFVRWGNLLGRYQPTDDMSADAVEEAKAAAVATLDLQNDRMFIIVSPHNSPTSTVAVRAVIQVIRHIEPIKG